MKNWKIKAKDVSRDENGVSLLWPSSPKAETLV